MIWKNNLKIINKIKKVKMIQYIYYFLYNLIDTTVYLMFC